MQQYVRGRKFNSGDSDVNWEIVESRTGGVHSADFVNKIELPFLAGVHHNGVNAKPSKYFAVVESRSLLRDCFSMFLSTLYDASICGYESVEEMLEADNTHLDLVVMGWSNSSRQLMIGQLAMLCRECSPCPVIVMQDSCDYGMVSDVLRVGARGVVPTSLPTDVATEAIGLVMAGGSFIPAESMMLSQTEAASRQLGAVHLTAREEQVLALLKVGKQNKQIAYALGLSEGTVKVHLHNLMKKLGTSNRTQTIIASTV